MGLDMYLNKHTYVKNWSHYSPDEINKITVKKGGKLRKDIKPERISYIVEEVAYWRKFNALHGWFVNFCGDGHDDCKPIYIGTEQFEVLLILLKTVKEKLDNSKLITKMTNNGQVEVYECEKEIEDLFPPEHGFFFGSDLIDEYYKDNVDSTIEMLEEIVKDTSGDYYYQASW
jgi:hypothetical protein